MFLSAITFVIQIVSSVVMGMAINNYIILAVSSKNAVVYWLISLLCRAFPNGEFTSFAVPSVLLQRRVPSSSTFYALRRLRATQETLL